MNAVEQLRATGVAVHFEGVKAVDGVDLSVGAGEILGLIGPNGAGKTTLVNALTGFQRPTAGTVELGDSDITGWAPNRRARNGLGRTFQNTRLFPSLTVLENVEVAAVAVRLGRKAALARAWEVLEHMGLDERAHLRAEALSAGEERRVGIARALATGARFLMLDEPAAGLNESESDDLSEALRNLRKTFGYGFVVIEHDMRVIMGVCDRVQVLDYGKTIAVGTPAEVQRSEAVLTAYLGTHVRTEKEADASDR
jgi:branched-chain amino acid transport system ATP-binding protein